MKVLSNCDTVVTWDLRNSLKDINAGVEKEDENGDFQPVAPDFALQSAAFNRGPLNQEDQWMLEVKVPQNAKPEDEDIRATVYLVYLGSGALDFCGPGNREMYIKLEILEERTTPFAQTDDFVLEKFFFPEDKCTVPGLIPIFFMWGNWIMAQETTIRATIRDKTTKTVVEDLDEWE